MQPWRVGNRVYNPKNITWQNLTGEFVDVGGTHDLKPSLGFFNEKEMVLFTHHFHYEQDAHGAPKQFTHSVMFRSEDGGKTWGRGKHNPFNGLEACITVVDGVMLVTRGEYIHRSEDRGETWENTEITTDMLPGCIKDCGLCTSRNFVKMSDGSIIVFVNAVRSGTDLFEKDQWYETYRLRSTDLGKTWEAEQVTYVDYHGFNLLTEAFSYVTPSGRLMAVGRVIWAHLKDMDIPHKVVQEDFDELDTITGMVMLESKDQGITWEVVRGLGYLTMMYPSVAYVDDHHFVLTYTARGVQVPRPYPHMGVQAVIGTEHSDGTIEIDFDHDIIIIDDRTPDCAPQTEGFGLTQKLPDGSLITPYSFREIIPSWEKVLSTDEYKTDAVFLEAYIRSGCQWMGEGNHMNGADHVPYWWRDMNDDMKRVMVDQYSMRLGRIFFKTQVLKWTISGLDEAFPVR